jgi:outer membrane protein
VQADVIREVKVAYFRILKAERLVNVALQSVAGLLIHRDQAQMFYNHGLIPKNDLLTAEVELTNGNQQLLRAQNGVELAKAGMNTLLRREIDAPVELEDIFDYRPYDKTWEDCLKTVLDNRPEIKSQILITKQAKTIVKQAKSAYLPTINFLGNYSRYGDEPGLSGSAYKSQENWYATLIANWNIWEGGRSKSRLDASLSKEKQALDAYLSVQQRIILELKEAYLHLREAEQQIPAAKKAVTQAEENLRITNERYREQVARAADVIDAQTLLTRAQTDYHNALGDYHISLAGLERAMGTGSAVYPPQ